MDRRGWHALGRLSGVSSLVALFGSVLWAGGCSDDARAYCDATGCYTCDGYGCTQVPSSDGGVIVPSDAGSSGDAGGSRDSGTTVCKFTSDCPIDTSCVNGQCLPTCSDTKPCSTGNKCVSGVCQPDPGQSQCTTDANCGGSTPKCVNGQCVPACKADSECPTGQYCPNGACVPDTRPKPNCSATDTHNCSTSQVCIENYCKFLCTNDSTCRRIDARIAWCAADGVCRTEAEAHPQCTTGSQCTAPQQCIDNVCK